MADPLRITVADLADGAASGPLLEADGRISLPLVAVDLASRAEPATLKRAIIRAQACDRLLIGLLPEGLPLAELVSSLDLTLTDGRAGSDTVTVADPETHLAELTASAERNPQAALMLGSVLRMTEHLPVPAALDVESLAYSTLLGGSEFQQWLAARGPRPEPPAVADPVLVARQDRHLLVTLNRPERRNAYGRQVRDALVDALTVARLDESVERIVLTGAGPSFCSGGDLDEFGTAPDLATAHLVRTRAGAGLLLHELASRTEARLHGACVGAGIELPAFAATVLAGPGTTFRLPELTMGLIPGAGGTVSIPRRIGRWRTLHLALTAAPLPTATALSWGLIDGMTT